MRSGALRNLAMTLTVVALVVLTPATASAQSLDVVHSETVPLGGSTLTVSFTAWPPRAARAMDVTVRPAEGIDGRTGHLRALMPDGEPIMLGVPGLLARANGTADDDGQDLPRHPLDRASWGLDTVALKTEGTWTFAFTVDGPEGVRTAVLALPVGPAPGPPAALSWTVGLLPWAAAVPFLVYGWRRSRAVRLSGTRNWHD